MSEYDFPDFESPSDGAATRTLPFGLSVQALSMILLILALLGVLWLFFGPSPDSPTGLATATARPADTLSESDSEATADAASEGPTSSAGGASTAGDGNGTAAPAATTLAGAATADLGTDEAEDSGSSSSASTGSGSASGSTAGTPAATGQAASSASTPAAITANGFVKVTNTDGYGLRLRFGAGLDYVTIRIVDDGEVLRVTGGPESGDGQRWYRLQDALGNVGWGAEDFITPAASPPLWSPPIASPTFPSSDGGAGAGASGAP